MIDLIHVYGRTGLNDEEFLLLTKMHGILLGMDYSNNSIVEASGFIEAEHNFILEQKIKQIEANNKFRF